MITRLKCCALKYCYDDWLNNHINLCTTQHNSIATFRPDRDLHQARQYWYSIVQYCTVLVQYCTVLVQYCTVLVQYCRA